MWFGGATMHPPLVRRLLDYGAGFIGFGPVEPEQIDIATSAFAAEGRDFSDLERVTFLGGRMPSRTANASLDEALLRLRTRREAGFSTFCIKPAQFVDKPEHLEEFMEEVVAKTTAITADIDDKAS